MKYKVYTKWIGYSEIEVEASSEEEARELAGSDVCTVVDDDIINFEHDMETLEEIF